MFMEQIRGPLLARANTLFHSPENFLHEKHPPLNQETVWAVVGYLHLVDEIDVAAIGDVGFDEIRRVAASKAFKKWQAERQPVLAVATETEPEAEPETEPEADDADQLDPE